MNMSNQTITASDREIVSVRVVNASREIVFKAWTDPQHLRSWWGPNGFTNTFHEFDLKPEGHWRFTMHGPDGTDYANHSVFVEIIKPEKLVFDHISGHIFRVTATFEEESPNSTKVIFRMLFESLQEFEKAKKYVIEGNEQNFDRLEVELKRMINQ
ncbi:SRPBCC family protein [Leptospira interrogans]|uniref:SRPBCC family protein n=3 Tax=Leptospira interrogans TaxID=173 RepID=A0AAV9G2X6_LEPIR|nr:MULTISPECIES: SRPBCC domain-containing protein [Leptospira]KAK2620690.1 SRPBCC family protein [Leptospira interrogans]MBE8344587.1 SRPBCC family protein [Leptospira interrogans serovar Pomona]MBE8354372.1 SRPBCC family protein [Leptospira interrogans serovar Pomona]MBE8358215.1 SRPBCC family protein [Leptospira interrogans serovar Pomona]MBE8386708.1 SRPBCC family protein [Leptospira interrogans serovar Pomona]